MSNSRKPLVADDELELYRSMIETPTEFKNGFTWVAVVGAFFCGLLMMPGAIYLGLMTGGGLAAAWVTLIIFSEISRRAMRTLSKQELVILLMVAGAMAGGGPFASLVWRQYFIQCDAKVGFASSRLMGGSGCGTIRRSRVQCRQLTPPPTSSRPTRAVGMSACRRLLRARWMGSRLSITAISGRSALRWRSKRFPRDSAPPASGRGVRTHSGRVAP